MKYLVLIILMLYICCPEKTYNETNQSIQDKKIESTDISISSNVHINDSLFYDVKLFDDRNDRTYDTVIHIDSLAGMFYEFRGFNYTKLQRKRVKDKHLSLFNDTIELKITEAPFDSSKHELFYEEGVGYSVGGTWTKIDGREFLGTDGGLPDREISGITIRINGKKKKIEKEYYSDLYQPNLDCWSSEQGDQCYTYGYIKNNREIILSMSNSDAAGSYEVVFIFDMKGNIKRRIIGNAW